MELVRLTMLYLVRHGQSMANITDTFAGSSDFELTKLGVRQAELLSSYFENIFVNSIYSSDLSRAVNTIMPTAEKKGIKIIKDRKLREIFGGEWENKSFDYINENYSEDFLIWKTDPRNACCPGGESVADVEKRVFDEITKIAEKNIGKNVVVATHAMAVRTFVSAVSGIDIKDVPWVSNASVSSFYYDDGVFSLKQSGYDDYLCDIKTTFNHNI